MLIENIEEQSVDWGWPGWTIARIGRSGVTHHPNQTWA